MDILVTGGAGFIGSHLVENLVLEGNNVSVVDDFSSGKQNYDIINEKCDRIFNISITNKDKINEIQTNFDLIIHLAAMNRAPRSIENPQLSNEININGTLNLLEFSRRIDSSFINISSSSVFGHSVSQPRMEEDMELAPKHPYGLGKLTSEHYTRLYRELYGINGTTLRYFAIYGPRQSPFIEYSAVIPLFIQNAMKNKDIIIHGGDQTRNFCYVADAVKATKTLAYAKNFKNNLYHVGGVEEISILNLAKKIINITNSKSKIIKETYREGDIFRSIPSLEKLKNEFQFNLDYSIEIGLRKTIDWMKSNEYYFGK